MNTIPSNLQKSIEGLKNMKTKGLEDIKSISKNLEKVISLLEKIDTKLDKMIELTQKEV